MELAQNRARMVPNFHHCDFPDGEVRASSPW
jgi:hypothetical protein